VQRAIRIVGHSPEGLPPEVPGQLRELALYEWDISQELIENVPSPAEFPSSGESQESGNSREISQHGVPKDGQSHETSVNHDSSRTGGDGKRKAGNKRTRPSNDLSIDPSNEAVGDYEGSI